jgi:hypothetical protein
MSGASPAPVVIKLSRSCVITHAGMYRGGFVPYSSCNATTSREGRVFVSINTPTRRFLCDAGAVRRGSLSQSVLGGGVYVVGSCSSRVGTVSSIMFSSVVWCLVPASIVTRRSSRGEYIVPPPLNADLIAAWVSLQAASCLLMIWSLWVLHCPAMCVQESS